MPELPEVETVLRALKPRINDGVISDVRLPRPDIVTPTGADLPRLLKNQTIQRLHRRGKRLIFTLTTGQQFIIRLGMTGRLTLHPHDEPCRLHTHLVLTIRPKSGHPIEVRFCDPRRFGGIEWLQPGQPADAGLGPEPLTITPAKFAAAFARTRRPIKSALLDQQLIAGIGNIYADEALFLARIHPSRSTHTLTRAELDRLHRDIQTTLKLAIRHGGSTVRDYVNAAGTKGSFQDLHNVYGRESQPCHTCRTPIQRLTLAGRSTCYCPKCQPAR